MPFSAIEIKVPPSHHCHITRDINLTAGFKCALENTESSLIPKELMYVPVETNLRRTQAQ